MICHQNFNKTAKVRQKSGNNTVAKREEEIAKIAEQMIEKNAFEFTPGREHASFLNFSSGLLSGLNVVDFNNWLNKNKKGHRRKCKFEDFFYKVVHNYAGKYCFMKESNQPNYIII